MILRCVAPLMLLLSTARALDKVNVAAQIRVAPGKSVSTTAAGREATQTRFLEMNITNRTREDLSGLSVKWTLFGSDLKNNDTVISGSGEAKSSLAPGRSEKLNTPEVVFSYSRAGVQKGNAKGVGRARRAEPAGSRYSGWAVRVYQEGNLVGEAYSLPEFKAAE
jgi:hypothetical protein